MSIYANGSRGAVVRAALLPHYPFCWIVFLEDFMAHGKDTDYLHKSAGGESVEGVIGGAFLFSDTEHCYLWKDIVFEKALASREIMLRLEHNLREEMSVGAINPPLSKKEVTPLGLVSRKIYLPKK